MTASTLAIPIRGESSSSAIFTTSTDGYSDSRNPSPYTVQNDAMRRRVSREDIAPAPRGMRRSPGLSADLDILDPLSPSESSRRVRTRSWAEQVAESGGALDADDGYLKPPTGRGVPMEEGYDRTYPIDDSHSISSWTSRRASDKVGRQLRKASDAPSFTSRSSTTLTESDEELASMSSADLGRMIIQQERKEREKRYKDQERRKRRDDYLTVEPPASRNSKRDSGSTSANRSREPSPVLEEEKTPRAPGRVKEKIISIDELVNRHKDAMARPESIVMEKARKELGIASPTLPSPRSPATPRPKPKKERPVIPSRTSSSPTVVKLGVVPPRTSSRTSQSSGTLGRSSSETQSTATGSESVIRNALLNQAALEHLENDARAPSPAARKISFQTDRETPPRARATTPFKSPGRKGTPSIKEDEEEQVHAVAIYLRSPNLNRYFAFPRPYPDQSLRVSVAEVGNPTGSPVLLFLGLGCVRYLTALFDELAKALDLRLICIDRWGYGKTDMVDEEKRGLREWAAIVERVVDEMKIKRFSVLAHSAGCPYALACANRMKERIVGKIHLLAPWVGTDVDNSYKWLKWVPNGIIKSATAAEWKLQSYFLGKPPPLSYSPIGHDATRNSSSTHLLPSPLGTSRNGSMLSVAGSHLGRKPSFLHRASSLMLRSKPVEEPGFINIDEALAVESGTLPMAPLARIPSAKHWKGISPRSRSDSIVSTLAGQSALGSSADLHDPSSMNFGLSEGFDLPAANPEKSPLASKKSRLTSYSYSYSYSYSRPNTSKSSSQRDSPTPPSGPSFGVALQQASHAECEPGTTADLLSIVLNREHVNRPWQYALNYADFSLPVKIYWGSEDDKISEKSVRWMEKTMTAGVELHVLEGEGHNLMTSSGTMLAVFQSLAAAVKEELEVGIHEHTKW